MDLSDYHIEKLNAKLNDINTYKYQLNRIKIIVNLMKKIKNPNEEYVKRKFPEFMVFNLIKNYLNKV